VEPSADDGDPLPPPLQPASMATVPQTANAYENKVFIRWSFRREDLAGCTFGKEGKLGKNARRRLNE
jgi:hypothetical protein